MILSPLILTILVGLVGLVWSSRHVKIWREMSRGFALTESYAGPPEAAPRVSILVAAKDEQASVETCIRSLLAQDYPSFEIIAADDRSEDDTGPILDRLAAEDPRVRTVHIRDLPPGWAGKNHALHTALQHATGQVLFFTDADCRLVSRRTLSVARPPCSPCCPHSK
jgi:cellulose synthase/poly-beta-1,6-N-acetylglucosamine synthase-like glycosyltransferase